MNNSIYSNIKESKTGDLLPFFTDGKSMDSFYNPVKEAESIILQLEKSYNFFIITGLGSGILLKNLLQSFPESKIIVIENSQADYDYLKQIPLINTLYNNKNVIFSTISSIKEDLQNNYIPALYGELKIIQRQSWISHINFEELNLKVSEALNIISNDFATQSFFGKLWQYNIIKNLKLYKNCNKIDNKIQIDINKTALVVAAGPSIDSKVDLIKKQRNNYFIIATDTAFSILSNNNIQSDIAISIDGQNVSYNHFNNLKQNYSNTIFLFDFCANPNCVSYLQKKNATIGFFKSMHPLLNFIKNDFKILSSGTGTITMSALDLAVQLGFKNIEIFGADFGYINGKSYAKGTYLDTLYQKSANKIEPSELIFDKLLFRTNLIKNESKVTTKLLLNYQQSLENYVKSYGLEFKKENYSYKITNNSKKSLTINDFFTDFKYDDFICKLKSLNKEQLLVALLPYIAFLRGKNSKLSWEEYLNKAYKNLLRLI